MANRQRDLSPNQAFLGQTGPRKTEFGLESDKVCFSGVASGAGSRLLLHEFARRRRNNPKLDVDRAHVLTDCLDARREQRRPNNTAASGKHDCARRADPVREPTGQQASKRRHADESRSVVAHHAASLIFRHQSLDDRIACGKALHHSKADNHHQSK